MVEKINAAKTSTNRAERIRFLTGNEAYASCHLSLWGSGRPRGVPRPLPIPDQSAK